ncbi:hypothetical protein [Arthrobacter sp. 35W]|uniref:hypothetical protein n=1 Tax=Arthrobacter sp. 35W TaxID=1132441 RepID=UPI0012DE608F|nr:hypothetical protein [Arthrobacter sp. 35W]
MGLPLLGVDLVELHANFVLRKHSVSGEIYQAFFFHLKFLELSGDFCVNVADTALFVGECLINPIVNICKEVGRQIE